MFLKATADTSEHAPSYYAASANWQTDYPQLEDNLDVEIVIVGAGFSGVSTAVELCERGYKVALIEANRISWGASGRNGGQIIGGFGHNPSAFRMNIGDEGVDTVEKMSSECVDIVKERIEKYNIDCDLKWGYCEVALKKRHLKDYQQWAEEEPAIKLLDRQQMKDYVNSDIYLGGYYREDWGHIQPLNLCIGEARAAEQMGAQIFEQSRVIDIQYTDRPVVKTEKGQITADKVILCGNAYMGDLVPRLDDRVLPSTSVIIATEPLSKEQVAQCMVKDVAVCDSRTALDYYRLSARQDASLFGGLIKLYRSRTSQRRRCYASRKWLKFFLALRNDTELTISGPGNMGDQCSKNASNWSHQKQQCTLRHWLLWSRCCPHAYGWSNSC